MLILVKIVTDDTSIVAENFISYFHKTPLIQQTISLASLHLTYIES